MSHVIIPATIEDARAALDGLGVLLTAKEWERAAIVYAFTREGGQGSYQQNRVSAVLTTGEFAALGIAGLRRDGTVRDYRKSWQSAIDDGYARSVIPGQKVDLPTRPYPPNPKKHTSTSAEVVAGVRKLLLNDPAETIHDITKAEPEVMSALAQGVSSSPALVEMILRDRTERIREVTPRSAREADYSADLRHGVNALLRVLSAMRDDKWVPDAMETTLLHFLRQAFAEIAAEQDTPTYNVIDEIEAFLVGQR